MNVFGFNVGKAPKEKKSLSTISISDIINAGQSSLVKDKFNLSTYKTVAYYASVSAVGKAVNLLSDEMASVRPWLQDIRTEKFIDHPELESLLSTPNPDKTKTELMKAYASYYLITGKSFLLALGPNKRPPLEFDVVSPDYIRIVDSKIDSYVDAYKYMAKGGSQEVTFRREEVRKRFRYYNENKRELWHVKMFNPYRGRHNEGLSPLDMVYYEVEQHMYSSRHNLSTLQKGARLSGGLSIEGELGSEQRAAIKAQIKNNYQGADNAGEILVVDGTKMTFTEFAKSMKDMDFLELKKEVTAAIYNIYSIPLPLIYTSAMTLNNYKEAMYALYNMAVLPLVNRLYEELSLFLLPRFGLDTTRYRIWYDKKEIPALELRRTEELKNKKELGIYKINELRVMDGLEAVEEGDVILQPSGMMPLGTKPQAPVMPGVNTDINNDTDKVEPGNEKPVEDIDLEDDKDETVKERFVRIMMKQMDGEKRRFSDTEIEAIAKEKGL